MSIPGSAAPFLLASEAAPAAYEIERSLRFNSSDSAYCSRAAGSPTASGTWTFSVWVKRSKLGSDTAIFGGRSGGVATQVYFKSDNTIRWYENTADFSTTAVFRDVSSWYHFVFAKNGSSSCTIYVNGVQLQQNTSSVPSTSPFNTSSAELFLGAVGLLPSGVSFYGDHYLADVHFIDGQALTPSSFTEVDATAGQLIPKAYTGTYGTNGFHLPFSDNSTAAALGTDTSGNGNDWATHNLSVTEPIVYQSSAPFLSSYPLSNWFDGNTTTYGQCEANQTAVVTFPLGGITVNSSLRIYVGFSLTASGFKINGVAAPINPNGGWNDYTSHVNTYGGGVLSSITVTYTPSVRAQYIYAIEVDGVVLVQGTPDSLVDTPTNYGTDTGAGGEVRGNYCTWNPLLMLPLYMISRNGNLEAIPVSNDYNGAVLNIPITVGNSGKWYVEFSNSFVNTTSFTGFGVVANQTAPIGQNTGIGYIYLANGDKKINGNTSSYGSAQSSGDIIGVAVNEASGVVTCYRNGVSQGTLTTLSPGLYQFMGIGYGNTSIMTVNAGQRPFAYTAPSGFKALCTTNLPDPVVAQPSTVMDVKLYTGTGGARSISGLGFSPDFVWIKNRNVARSHRLFDAVRGATKRLYSDTTDVEGTDATSLTQFNADGFNLEGNAGVNNLNDTYVAWAWDAGSSTVTNTQGSITSQVRANASAGFSIVTYTANETAGQTVGHGLGVAPEMFIFKKRNTTSNWIVVHKGIPDPWNNYSLALNLTDAVSGSRGTFSNVAPTSTVFAVSISGAEGTNDGTNDYVCYCFAPVAGYSSGFSYTGNGSTDGSFVYLGFRPRLILLKCSSTTGNWTLVDTAREGYNVDNDPLYPNLSDVEGTTDLLDITSNGFKLRTTDASVNSSGATYIGFAWAELPFKTARAR